MEDDICESVKRKHGTTSDFKCTGFIMLNGDQINFCSKRKPEYNDTEEERTHEHCDMVSPLTIDEFLDECDAVQFRKLSSMPSLFVNTVKKPSDKQIKKIENAIEKENITRFHATKINPNIEIGNQNRYCKHDNFGENATRNDVSIWIKKCWEGD